MGEISRGSLCGGGGQNYPPYLKLVRVMLET